MGKIPPQVIDFEEMVIGGILLEKTAFEIVSDILTPDCFYKDCNNYIFKAAKTLYNNNSPIDILTVSNQLKIDGLIESIGGPFYLAQLTNKIASTANIEYHSRIIFQKYIQRELIKAGSKIQEMAFNEQDDISNILDSSNNLLESVVKLAIGKNKNSHISEVVKSSIKELEQRIINFKSGVNNGISTGLYDLNNFCQGWHSSELTILASRPAMGKTAMMLHFAISAARMGKSVCIYSLEMNNVSLVDRMVVKLSDILADDYRSGNVKDIEWPGIERAINELDKLPIYIDDNSCVSMSYIKSHSKMMNKKGQCDIIFADYLQLVDMGITNRNREQDVSKASREAKLISKDLDVPFILLSQLSRNVEQRGGDKRPQLSDLRDSGAIEQDADNVIFIHRPEYYGMEKDANGNDLKGIGKLIFAKQRNGKTGDIVFKYNESLTKIFDFSPIEDDWNKPIKVNNNFYEKDSPF